MGCWSCPTTACAPTPCAGRACPTTGSASASGTTGPSPRSTGPAPPPEQFTDYAHAFLPAEHISDSGVVGVRKPHPAIFAATAAGLGLPPGRVCHIGDTAGYDAEGAAAAGMHAVHVDPLGSCAGDHVHVASLAHFADRLLGPGPA